MLSIRLATLPPFDGVGVMQFLAAHAIVGLEFGDDETFSRAIRLPHGVARLTVGLDGTDPDGTVGIRLESDVVPQDENELISRVARLFDLRADSSAIDTSLSRDPFMAELVAATPGIRMAGALDPEEALFRTMIGQQISVAAARTVLGRLCSELGSDGLFPTALQFAEHGTEALRGPASRVATIIRVAEKLASGEVELDATQPSVEFQRTLLALPGVGPWTAGYLAMRVRGDADVLLTSDLVIAQSAAAHGLPRTDRELAQYGERWAPWRSYASLHLWRARPAPIRRRRAEAAALTIE